MQKRNSIWKKSGGWSAVILTAWLIGNSWGAEPAKSEIAPAKISDRTAKIVEDLLKTLNFEHVYERATAQQLEELLAQNPSLNHYATEIKNFYARYCRYELLKPRIMEIYAAAFTDSEFTELTGFFRTATGRKWIENYPTLLRQIHELGEQQAQKYRGELQKIIGDYGRKNSANQTGVNRENSGDTTAADDDAPSQREAPDDQW